jgi:hypothetical protein
VVAVATVSAADVAEALDIGWQVFRWATGDDAEGWDMTAAIAEGRPSLASNLFLLLATRSAEVRDAHHSSTWCEPADRYGLPDRIQLCDGSTRSASIRYTHGAR